MSAAKQVVEEFEGKAQTAGFPDEILTILRRPMDPRALTAAPRGLTSIKSIYITERLNEAFGHGRWYVHDEVVEVHRPQSTVDRDGNEKLVAPMVVVKAHLELINYPWFRAASYGGNNNPDLGDAYKGAVSDAISKIVAMYLGVAVDVYKGLSGEIKEVTRKSAPQVSNDEPPVEAYADSTPKPNGHSTKPNGAKVPGKNDVTGKAAVSEAQAKRFIAIALHKDKSWEDINHAVVTAGLSDIKHCPWGKMYENLIAWAEA